MSERSTDLINQRIVAQAEQFVSDLGDISAIYSQVVFHYFALREGDKYCLEKARLVCRTTRQDLPKLSTFASRNVRAGCFELTNVGLDIEGVIDALTEGVMPTPDGPVHLLHIAPGDWNSHYSPLSEAGLTNQSRWKIFQLRGRRTSALPNTIELDWELKAQPVPFQGINQLLLEFGLDTILDEYIRIEFIAGSLVEIDKQSKMDGNKVQPAIFISTHLQKDKASIGYLVHDSAGVYGRGCVTGDSLSWEETEMGFRGSMTLEIPTGSVVLAFANYDDITYNEYWLVDLNSVPNPRRAAYDTFDSQLEVARDILLTPEQKRPDSKNVEAAIAWLLWMLGFSPAHLVLADKRLSDAVDIIVATPEQRLAVVECTAGHPNQNNKLSNLISRRKQVVDRLSKSGQSHVEVIAVIITTRTREEVAADIPDAEKNAVLVLTREDLEQMFNRSFFLTNPEEIYGECKTAIQEGLERQQTQPHLPTM